jgi:hypothetical protein
LEGLGSEREYQFERQALWFVPIPLKDLQAVNAVTKTGARSIGSVDFDGREGPLTAVRPLEMHLPL